jgi:pimeloyl-ACP methyl ester carboxylesterase
MHHPSSPPTVPTDESDKTSAVYTLPDGRELGYAQFGWPTGKPVFYLHGTPGSRVEAIAFDEMGMKLGARVIATDRPGYGWSSPHPGRNILDHAKDVEHLAESLKLDSYGVLVHCTPFPHSVGMNLLTSDLIRAYQAAVHTPSPAQLHYPQTDSNLSLSCAGLVPPISARKGWTGGTGSASQSDSATSLIFADSGSAATLLHSCT